MSGTVTSSSIHPRIQAQRIEAAARGEYVARIFRDFDLMEAGAIPECLALVGLRDATTPQGAATVAMWLCQLSEEMGFGTVTEKLFELGGRGYGDRFPKISHTRAGLALVRQIIAVAAQNATDPRPIAPRKSQLSVDAAVIGVWLAVLIEIAGLSHGASVLWQTRRKDDTPKAGPADYRAVSLALGNASSAAHQPEANIPPR